MNGQTPTDGGILYDGNETEDEDDLIEVNEAEAPAPAIGWAEGRPEVAGLKGAELIQAFVKVLPNGPAFTACSTRPATCSMSARPAA